MNEEKKNQIILISVIVGLLILVVGFTIFSIINKNNKSNNNEIVKFKQIYSSDYDLEILNNNYYLGLYNNKINIVINKEGNEVYILPNEIEYQAIYELEDGKNLICNYQDDKITLYIFEDEKIKLYDIISDISYGKPVFNKDNKIVAFVEVKDDGFDLYDISKKEVKELSGYTLVGDLSSNSKDYCENERTGCLLDYDTMSYKINNNSFIVKKDNLYGAVDFEGNEIIPFQYYNLLGVGNDYYIAKNKKGYYGLLNNDEIKIKFQYKVIDAYDNYYLIVDKNNKMALYNKDLKNLTGFKMNYDSLIDYNPRNNKSIMLYENDNVFIVNNYLEDYNKTEYEKHSLYVYNGSELKEYKEYGLFIDKDIYLYDKDYNITIYDNNMKELNKIKIDSSRIKSITKYKDEILKIDYYDKDSLDNITTKYLKYNGDEIDYSKYGTPCYINNDYEGFISNGNTLQIVLNDKVVGELKEPNIKVINNQIITQNNIYIIETP